MSFELSQPGFWLDALQTAVIAALWLRKPGEQAGEKVVAMEARVGVIEERIRHMPTADELTELEGTVKAIDAKLGGMDDAVKTTRSAVVRIEEFLRANR